MNRVLTITAWYDGPVEGVAYYTDEIVIYERIFSRDMDEYTENYYLTPISSDELEIIMAFWRKWVSYVDGGYKGDFNCKNPIHNILDNSKTLHKYTKRGRFNIRNKYDINCEKWVEWI